MERIIKKTLKFWYIPLVLGILFSLAGIWAFGTPIGAYMTLTIFIVWAFIISGVIETVYAISNRDVLRNWGWYLVGGILGIVLGILLLSNPALTAILLSFYIGFWLLFRSFINIGMAIEMKSEGEKKWGWMLVLAILSVVFAFLLILNPVITGIAVGIWIGFSLLFIGIFNIMVSIHLKKLKNVRDDLSQKLDEASGQ